MEVEENQEEIETDELTSNLQKQSIYNSGLHQIERISNLKNLAHTHAEKGEWNNYRIVLDRIFIELAPNCKHSEKIEAIKKEVSEVNSIRTGFDSNTMNKEDYPKIWIKVKIKNAKLKKVLERYEILLRKEENRQGMGMAFRNESDEGI